MRKAVQPEQHADSETHSHTEIWEAVNPLPWTTEASCPCCKLSLLRTLPLWRRPQAASKDSLQWLWWNLLLQCGPFSCCCFSVDPEILTFTCKTHQALLWNTNLSILEMWVTIISIWNKAIWEWTPVNRTVRYKPLQRTTLFDRAFPEQDEESKLNS